MSGPSNTPAGILLLLAGVWVLGQTFAGGLVDRLLKLGATSSSTPSPTPPAGSGLPGSTFPKSGKAPNEVIPNLTAPAPPPIRLLPAITKPSTGGAVV